MSDQTILDTIDPEIVDTLVTRRDAIRKGASVSAVTAAALAAGTIPLAIAGLASSAYAQTGTPAQVLAVLKFAYVLENLEAEFYKTVEGTGTGFSSTNNPQASAFAGVRALFGATEVATIDQIRKHEESHVAVLKTALASLGFTAPTFTGADFDFTGGNQTGFTRGAGPFAGATAATPNGKAFLLVATQAFEDTGVRAYKGQAPNLMGDANASVLETALRIHSVEARHASRIRRLRRLADSANTVLRYSGTIRGGGAAAAGAGSVSITPAAAATAVTNALGLIYGGEDNVTQGGVNVTTLSGLSGFGIPSGDISNAATEAFDEPLDAATVKTIVAPFLNDATAKGLLA